MRIDKITIEGYRRFNKSAINLNHGNFAILAGANNSGKTSLIQLLDIIFNNKSRKAVGFKDFSITLKSLLNNKVKELDFSSDFNDLYLNGELTELDELEETQQDDDGMEL